MRAPTADRPVMPAGYGLPESDEGLLSWSDVEQRLVEAATVWLATTRPDGRPHVIPRWGVWLDGRFWYDGSPETVHRKNLAGNDACVLHVESGTEVVIVEGRARPADPVGPELGERLSGEFVRKYAAAGYAPGPDSWAGEDAGGLGVLVPEKVLAWFSFPTDLTRFRFT